MKEPIINSGFNDVRVGNTIKAEIIKNVKGLCPMGDPKRFYFCLKDSQIYVEKIESGDFRVTSIGHSPLLLPKNNPPERER